MKLLSLDFVKGGSDVTTQLDTTVLPKALEVIKFWKYGMIYSLLRLHITYCVHGIRLIMLLNKYLILLLFVMLFDINVLCVVNESDAREVASEKQLTTLQ